MFVDFDYYQNEYGGSELTENEFVNLSKKSERIIDSLMGNKIFYDNLSNYPSKVINFIKDCICENAEFLKNVNEFADTGITSYSINGVAMTLNDSSSSNYIKTSIYAEMVSLGLISLVM